MEPMDAEFHAAEAMSADHDTWITFDGQSNTESFEEWLDRYQPSQVSRYDGIGWIAVHLPNDSVSSDTRDVIGLQQAWEQLNRSGQPINYETIVELAQAYNVCCGKWFMHVDSGGKVDHIWRLVAYGVMEGRLGHSAKVSPYDETQSRHVICIYNEDFTNTEEVFQLENAIRQSCGIKCSMKYKPDIYTYLGIYRNNSWGLRPSVYESLFDLMKGRSSITSTHSNS